MRPTDPGLFAPSRCNVPGVGGRLWFPVGLGLVGLAVLPVPVASVLGSSSGGSMLAWHYLSGFHARNLANIGSSVGGRSGSRSAMLSATAATCSAGVGEDSGWISTR